MHSPSAVWRRIEAPIFVTGCCNSGTTIVWRALRAHPDVHGPQVEGQDLTALPAPLRHFLGRQTFRMFAHPRFRGSYAFNETDYTATLAARVDSVYAEHATRGRRFIEKSPANAIRTRLLQSIYPDATFVLIVRDGFAVSEGIVRKRLFDPDRPHMIGMSTSIGDAALQWRAANAQMLADSVLLRRRVVIRYEDLVADPVRTLIQVCRACALDPSTLPMPTFENDLNRRQIGRLSASQYETMARIIAPARFSAWACRPASLASGAVIR